jgi:hypothetical protein
MTDDERPGLPAFVMQTHWAVAGTWQWTRFDEGAVVGTEQLLTSIVLRSMSLRWAVGLTKVRAMRRRRPGTSCESPVDLGPPESVDDLEALGLLHEARWFAFGLYPAGPRADRGPKWSHDLYACVRRAQYAAAADHRRYVELDDLARAALGGWAPGLRALSADYGLDTARLLAAVGRVPAEWEPRTPAVHLMRGHGHLGRPSHPLVGQAWRRRARRAGGGDLPWVVEEEARRQAIRLAGGQVRGVHLLLAILAIDEQLAATEWADVGLARFREAASVLRSTGLSHSDLSMAAARAVTATQPSAPSRPRREWRSHPSLLWTVAAEDCAERMRQPSGLDATHLVVDVLESDPSAGDDIRRCGVDPDPIRATLLASA